MADSIKQSVQWFPGHMAKTRRLLRECLPQVDAVVEVLDARVPESSRNPELSELTKGKPRIVLLNKCDVADAAATDCWLCFFRKNGFAALAVDCRSGKGLKRFVPLLREVLHERIEKNNERGMAGKPLRCMVVGIPNTGKSSFINKMAGRVRAEVADRAGVTRQNRWFAIATVWNFWTHPVYFGLNSTIRAWGINWRLSARSKIRSWTCRRSAFGFWRSCRPNTPTACANAIKSPALKIWSRGRFWK